MTVVIECERDECIWNQKHPFIKRRQCTREAIDISLNGYCINKEEEL